MQAKKGIEEYAMSCVSKKIGGAVGRLNKQRVVPIHIGLLSVGSQKLPTARLVLPATRQGDGFEQDPFAILRDAKLGSLARSLGKKREDPYIIHLNFAL